MSYTLEQTKSKLNKINNQVSKNYEQTQKAIAEVKSNRDFTDQARSKKVEVLNRKKDEAYRELMEQKQQIVTEADGKLRKRLYSGSNSSDIQFDQAAQSYAGKKDSELISALESAPSDETLRAVMKAAVNPGGNPRWKVLETAANKHSSVKDKVLELADLHREYGSLEDQKDRLARALFGDHASA